VVKLEDFNAFYLSPLILSFLKIQLIKREYSNRNLLLLVHFKYRFNIIKAYLIDNLMIYPPPHIDLPSLALTFSHKSLKKAKSIFSSLKKTKPTNLIFIPTLNY